MGIFGWSYPPGCSGPPDTEGPDDALVDSVYDLLGDTDDAITDKVIEFAKKLRSDAYAEGYRDGKSDEGMARDYNTDKACTILQDAEGDWGLWQGDTVLEVFDSREGAEAAARKHKLDFVNNRGE